MGICFLDNYNEYEFNGSITSITLLTNTETLDQENITSEYDLMAAFVNGDQRGVACANVKLQMNVGGGVQLLMVVYGNEPSGDILSFQFYDYESDD